MNKDAVVDAVHAQREFSKQFTDNPELLFKDISDEYSRTYAFPEGQAVTVDQPKALCVKVSSVRPSVGSQHSHIIVLNTGMAKYIPAGWLSVTWQVKSGHKPVAF